MTQARRCHFMLDALAPASPAPTVAPGPTPVDPVLVTDAHLLLSVITVVALGSIILAIRRWLIERGRDPLCVCNDPQSHHQHAERACADCLCRCFIERPAA